MPEEISPKSRLAVTLLAFFLGYFGAHRFYLGKIGTAFLMLFTIGGLGVWALVDFIFAIAGIMKDKDGKLIKNWEGSSENLDTIEIQPLDIARERYAKGEISKEEFQQLQEDLTKS